MPNRAYTLTKYSVIAGARPNHCTFLGAHCPCNGRESMAMSLEQVIAYALA